LKYFFTFILSLISFFIYSQIYSEEAKLLNPLRLEGGFPLTLTTTRSAVFYDQSINNLDLQNVQSGFQQTGIDAVTYIELARSMSGMDCKRSALKYLLKRDIKFLIFLTKQKNQYSFKFAPFNSKIDFVDSTKPCWLVQDQSLNSALKRIYQEAIGSEKKQNFLINDLPEYISENEITPINGRRNELLATDLGYFAVAFPKFGEETPDKEFENYLAENYTGKYEIVDAYAEESDLRKKGFLFILRFIHTKGSLAKNILGYQTPESESALASATFINGELQLKTIPSSEEIYKFYFKKLETGEVFLGKWDADITWQDALKNHLNAYKAEKKLK